MLLLDEGGETFEVRVDWDEANGVDTEDRAGGDRLVGHRDQGRCRAVLESQEVEDECQDDDDGNEKM